MFQSDFCKIDMLSSMYLAANDYTVSSCFIYIAFVKQIIELLFSSTETY